MELGIKDCVKLSQLKPYEYARFGVTLPDHVNALKFAIDSMNLILSNGRVCVCDICRRVPVNPFTADNA